MRCLRTKHVLERFQEHEPGADWSDVLRAVRYGLPIEPRETQMLIERPYFLQLDRHILSADFRGIFVLKNKEVLVTYLRLSEANQAKARDWFGSFMEIEIALVSGSPRANAHTLEQWLASGMYYDEHRHFDKAATCYRMMLELDPNNEVALTCLRGSNRTGLGFSSA